jgi:DNA segregation ATPase FtsK/SpoIIIE-like protein
VGIEIPNPNARIVRLKELLGSTEFAKAMQKSLTNLAI